MNITTPTLTQPQDIGASHQEEPHAGPANRTGVKPMQPWSMTAITGGDPLMRQQPSEDPLFLRGDSDMPRPQQRQQQPSRARARPRQPAGQGQRQQVGSFRAPRPSAGRACNSLPFPPQQVSSDIPWPQASSCPPQKGGCTSFDRGVDLEARYCSFGVLRQLVEHHLEQLQAKYLTAAGAFGVQLKQTCELAGGRCRRLQGHIQDCQRCPNRP